MTAYENDYEALKLINQSTQAGGQAVLPDILMNKGIDWSSMLPKLEQDGFIKRVGSSVQLTEAGKEKINS